MDREARISPDSKNLGGILSFLTPSLLSGQVTSKPIQFSSAVLMYASTSTLKKVSRMIISK